MMKFKLVENYKVTRSAIQEYAYDAIDELGNSSLEDYIQWFSELSEYFDEEVKQAVKDFYIEAIDCGKINRPKTMITSELTTYLESNADLIDKDIDELINNCPAHLKHELTLVLDKIDDSLNESLLDDANYWNSPYDHAVFRYINENSDLVDDIETLYQRCSKYLKPSLVKILDHAEVVDSLSVKRAQYLLQTYDPLVLINVIRDKDDTFRGNSAFDALEYGVNHWEDLFSDITLNESLNEELLTENTLTNIEAIINTAFAGTGCVITTDPHKKFYLIRTPLNNTYCIPVVQQGVKTSSDYNKRRYRGNGTVVNGKLIDSSGTTLGPAYYGVPSNHNHYDYDDINLYQYSKHPSANGAGLSLPAFIQDVRSGRV